MKKWTFEDAKAEGDISSVFLTQNGEGDLVVMDNVVYDQREKQLQLREKLIEIEKLRKAGIPDIPARTASENLRALLKKTNV